MPGRRSKQLGDSESSPITDIYIFLYINVFINTLQYKCYTEYMDVRVIYIFMNGNNFS